MFLHDALVEYMKCGDTSYVCAGFDKTLFKLCEPVRGHGGLSQVEKQFEVRKSSINPSLTLGKINGQVLNKTFLLLLL